MSNADKEAVGFIPAQELAILTYYSWDLRRDVLWGTSFRRRWAWKIHFTSISSTSSIFTKDHLGGISREEEDGDSKWVSRLGWTGGAKGLECTSIGRKSIGVDSFTPKGLGVGKSSWCYDLVEVSGTFH